MSKPVCVREWESGGWRQWSTSVLRLTHTLQPAAFGLRRGDPRHVYTHSPRQLWASPVCLCLHSSPAPLSRPHSSSSSSLRLIGPHPHLLSLTPSRRRYRCSRVQRSPVAAAQAAAFELHMWDGWDPGTDTLLIPAAALSPFLPPSIFSPPPPSWYPSVAVSAAVQKAGNDQFDWGGSVAACLEDLCPLIATWLSGVPLYSGCGICKTIIIFIFGLLLNDPLKR